MPIDKEEDFFKAIKKAKRFTKNILIEKRIKGDYLKIVLIGFGVSSIARYFPPVVIGTGKHTVLELIKKHNRRKVSATEGRCKVPLDRETKAMIKLTGYDLDFVLPLKKELVLRKNVSESSGEIKEYITDSAPAPLKKVAVSVAKKLGAPIIGLDLLVPDLEKPDFYIVEANPKPNIESSIEVEKISDLFFPETPR